MTRPLALLIAFVFLVTPARMFAKAEISRVTIEAPNLKTPIEITDPKALALFDVWSGPRTTWSGNSPNHAHTFIVDWSHPVGEPPTQLPSCKVSFYAKMPSERLVYVVFYKHDPASEQGYVYLPGPNEEWYRINVATIVRGVEGRWFLASPKWDNIAMRLINEH